jgi:catechol 2,3-dioxygenase-like lactoylglutathione lyase family enzyme
MLADEKLTAFLWTADAERARAFYEGVLGLTFAGDHGHLVHFESGPTRVAFVRSEAPITPPPGTAMGWQVRDLIATVKDLTARGVAFERGDLPHDDLGIWSPVPGQGVAWFLDPDGNRLSVNGPLV